MDRAIKFQNPIVELNINVLDEYLKIFNIYHKGIFISSLFDCKTAKYNLEKRKDTSFIKKFSDKNFENISSLCPFNLYLIDTFYKAFAVITVEKIYQTKKDIPEELFKLIPEQLQDFCAYAYYQFSNFNILPYELSNSVININTKKPLYDAKQINPMAPWYVEQINGILGDYLIQNAPKLKNASEIGYHPNYCVYRYYINLPNGQMNYIGMTGNIQDRYNHHKNSSSWSSKNEQYKFLYMAFKNVGYDQFIFEILHDNLTEKEAHYLEAKEIQNFNAYYPYGFNIRNEDKYLELNN